MTDTVDHSSMRRLLAVSIVESCTLVLLVCLAVPLKYLAGWDLGVRIMGPVHGLAFIAYVWSVLSCAAEQQWPLGVSARYMMLAFVPFGSFLSLKHSGSATGKAP